MNLGKYKWKSRVLLVSTPNYKDRIYLETKKIYQDKIKDFHKRYVKLICKINIKEKSSINLIGFDGKSKKKMSNLNYKTIFKIIDKMPLSKKYKPINLSLYSDYNPKTTTHGLGFKDKVKADYTVKAIKNRNLKYQVNVIATMLGRAKKHPNQSKGMRDAILVFNKWMVAYKKKNKSKK